MESNEGPAEGSNCDHFVERFFKALDDGKYSL
ncbi:UDP-glucose 4-epimerase related protein [Corchorus olitorius]|uniref:UDP-glucose 4-epimerase related protein n=1 Tax=Corchorus olitorius TaxID=93759 RepID=A0A1R3HG68_9ROSI|nr:UDP-glucose 4-epimerase related protein [Corchorus olitorius]